MKPELWKRVEAFFAEVADLQREERAERLEGIRKTDPELYTELKSLLEAHDGADELLGDFEKLVSEPDFEPLSDPLRRLNAALEGRYAVGRELGRGGMATVYLADDLKHERKVALKVLRPELAALVGAERFLAEIRTTANLQHPHILPLFDSGEAEGFLFYVMPYVEGETLKEKLYREHQLSVDEALRLTTAIAEALETAHEQGVIHRDIKPGNILLSGGHPLVADFGIALAVSSAGGDRLTETGLSMGTPHYMSPEQAAGESHIDARSDIYSLAAMLYEMLAGEPPYTGRTAQVVLAKRIAEPVPSVRRIRGRVPESVDATIQQALAAVPADRFATTGEFIAALTTLAVSEPEEPMRWKQWAAGGVAAALVTAIGLGLALGTLGRSGTGDELSRTIVVLPFENLSPGGERDYVARGVTEEISNELSKIVNLRLMSSTAVEQLLQEGASLGEMATELGVGRVLEGSVRQSGNEIRVTAQLIDAATNEQIWSGEYDRTVETLFNVRGEIALEIAGALEATLTSDEARRLSTAPTTNPAAYQLYLRSRGGLGSNAERNRTSMELLVATLVLDSTYADAYARLSWALVWQHRYTGDRRWSDSALVVAEKVLALDPELSFAHFAMAESLWSQGRLSQASRSFLRAIELDPNDVPLDLS
ncbi:MAG: protein kinase, partial [Gemmatimonadota bacterium]